MVDDFSKILLWERKNFVSLEYDYALGDARPMAFFSLIMDVPTLELYFFSYGQKRKNFSTSSQSGSFD